MSAPILLVHGWGFDAGIWDAVAALLPGRALFRAEAGYAGDEPRWPPVPPGTIAVGHSAGVPALLGCWPEGCAGLVSIAGFTRFAAADGFPGVPARVLDRMAQQFDADPRATLDAFRFRCGAGAAGAIVPDRLADGLRALREADGREAAAALFGTGPEGTKGRSAETNAPGSATPPGGCVETRFRLTATGIVQRGGGVPDTVPAAPTGLPLLALAASDDPIVVPAHSRACFASDALHWSEGGGHLLPLTRPDWCATMIRSVCA